MILKILTYPNLKAHKCQLQEEDQKISKIIHQKFKEFGSVDHQLWKSHLIKCFLT